jgi:uncharacterized protein YndB with AHSA1/START domain
VTTERLEVSRVIRSGQDRVFDAWTDPAQIVKWWGAGGIICSAAEMDLVEGGDYRIANVTPDGSTMWIVGTFSRVDAPNALSYTWAIEPITSETDFSQVEVTFSGVSEGTLVSIVHTRIATAEARETNLFGWNGCLEGLSALLAS